MTFRKLTTRERRTEPGDRGRRRVASREEFRTRYGLLLSFFICLFFFSLFNYHSHLLSLFGQLLSKPIMPRVEFWAGGGACPQGYPVPAFRFTRELDRAEMSDMRSV